MAALQPLSVSGLGFMWRQRMVMDTPTLALGRPAAWPSASCHPWSMGSHTVCSAALCEQSRHSMKAALAIAPGDCRPSL